MDGLSVALLRPLAELLGRLDSASPAVPGEAAPPHGGAESIDARGFLAALDIDDATAPDTYVDGERVDKLLDELAARRGDPAFALTLARLAVVRPLGLFGHLVWLSGTVGDAIERAVRFYSVITKRATLELEDRGAVSVAELLDEAGDWPTGRRLVGQMIAIHHHQELGFELRWDDGLRIDPESFPSWVSAGWFGRLAQ